MNTPNSSVSRVRQLERHVFDLTSLLTAGRALHNILNPDKLYEVLVAIVAEKLEAGPLALFMYDEQKPACRLVRTHLLPEATAPGFTFPIEEGLLWQNVLQYDPFPVQSASGEPLFERFFKSHHLQQFQSALWVPLFLKDQFIGLLTLGRRADRPYDDMDLDFLKQFAATAASSINMCHLYVRRNAEKDELSRTLRNLSMLYNISRAMTHISDLKQLLGYILEQAIGVANAQKGSIMLFNAESALLEVQVIQGLEDKDVQQKINSGEFACRTFKPGEGVAGQVYATGQPVILNKIDENDQFVSASSSFVDSIVCIPMKVHGEVIGVINVTNKQDQSIFSDEDVNLLAAIADQAAVAINKAQLWELSVTDSLTGLHIRRYLLARLNDELLRSRRFGHSLSVVMCDIDHFKKVNDTYGHDSGDQVLRAVAKSLRTAARAIDHVARYGGEEFILLLVETDKRSALQAADRLRELVAATTVPGLPPVTLSLGVATFPEDGPELETLVRKADSALYHAKEAGRNRVAGYRETPARPEPHPPIRTSP
ncbi:MAG: diguanylate cyclase [Lentisphaerae bacterium]|nr:diguanylate cyclase [Lentisphaerota bacterium]